MIDVKGLQYANHIMLLPFTSEVLIVDPYPAQPFIQIYASSVIENATPSVLEMIYDLNLARMIPAASSFYVKVNSVDRNINTIAISGTKVMLTLVSPVVYGDIVTIGYTKSPTNPLQTASGVIVESITNQPVTNNCLKKQVK